MRPITVRVGPLAAASANAVALSQAGSAGLPLILNGALAASMTAFVLGQGFVTVPVATPDTPRRIGITSAGNDSTNTFTIRGTNWSGEPISETLVGANAGTVQSVLDYASITSITPLSATASTVTVGTTAVASSPWVRLDEEGIPQITVQADVSGTVTATLEQTVDDPNAYTNAVAPALMTWLPSQDSNAVGFSAPFQTNYAFAPQFARCTLTAGTGYVTVTYVQTGTASPS